jgi:hypothetical protein
VEFWIEPPKRTPSKTLVRGKIHVVAVDLSEWDGFNDDVEVISMAYFLTLKEILTRRQRNKWDVDYLLLLLLVEVSWICASSHPLVTCLYGTSQFE